MIEWIGVGLITAAALTIAGIGGLAFVRIRGYRDTAGEAIEAYEPAAYAPLARLMAQDDVEFLQRQASCGPELAADWNRARRKIVRLFLNEIAADFGRLHVRARALVAEAPEQYAELAHSLMRQQFTFWRIMAGLEVRLLLSGLGIGAIDGKAVVELLETMRAEIARSTASVTA